MRPLEDKLVGKHCVFSILFPYSVALMQKNMINLEDEGATRWKEPQDGRSLVLLEES